jgi:hypothetical protein
MDDRDLQNVSESPEKISEQTNESAPQKKRHRRVRYAAPLGFLVLLFACIGVITVISGGIRFIVGLTDDTPLREELYTFLDPIMQFCPSNFTDASDGEQDALLLAAVYRVSEAERIRQLREKDDTCTYTLDETRWRMQIPQTVIQESFTYLFGDAVLTHKTVGEVEYNETEQIYYVPLSINTSGYTPVLGSVKKSGDTYTVQVAYVANSDVEVDEKGETIPPTFNMGKYTQQYTVRRNEGGSLTLLSVEASD